MKKAKISAKNYFDVIKKIGVSKLPPALQQSHTLIVEKTDEGKNWSCYRNDPALKKMMDVTFKKTGEFIASEKKLSGSLSGLSQETPGISMLKKMLGWNSKEVTKSEVASCIDTLQRQIRSKQITKKSPAANAIALLQDKLVAIYNSMGEKIKIELSEQTQSLFKDAIKKTNRASRRKANKGLEGCCVPPAKANQASKPEIMCSTEFANLRFETIGFKDKWLELIGDPCKGFSAMVFGKPKMGKSYLCVDFAGYLARSHGKVLYVAREEKLDATLQKKLNDKEVAHVNLFVSSFLPKDLSSYEFIFLDSVNKLGLSPADIESLRTTNPGKSFIFIFQTTKEGNFRGRNEFQHDVDVVIEVPEKGKAVQYGRFNQGGEIDIFKDDSESEISGELSGASDKHEKDAKQIKIGAYLSISLVTLAKEVLKGSEDTSDIISIIYEDKSRVENAARKIVETFLKWDDIQVTAGAIKFLENDSDNLSHGSSYFHVRLTGTMKDLKKIAGHDKLFYYEWDNKSRKTNSGLSGGKPYLYIIDVDERGGFFAHVENSNGKTVFTIKSGNELSEDESSIFEEGWMEHKEDTKGLEKYLKQVKLMTEDDWLTTNEEDLHGAEGKSMFAGLKRKNMAKQKAGNDVQKGNEASKSKPDKKERTDFAKYNDRKDELNPRYIFSLTATQLLCEALKGEFDIGYLVRKELANRGVDKEGKWVGFEKAKAIHEVD